VKEDEILFVYETDQDWLLVQSQKDGGKAGYVPGNYVEATSDAESTPTVDVPSVRYILPLKSHQAHMLFRPDLSVYMLILLTELPLPKHHSLMPIPSRRGQSQILTKRARRKKGRWVLGMGLYSLPANRIRWGNYSVHILSLFILFRHQFRNGRRAMFGSLSSRKASRFA